MKPASIVSLLVLGVWVLAHLIFCGFAALFLSAWMNLQFTEIHTSGTAMDPIEDLTRETVMWNIIDATLRYGWLAPVAGIAVYFISDVLWEHLGRTGKRIARFLALVCAAMLSGAIILADVQCYLKYP